MIELPIDDIQKSLTIRCVINGKTKILENVISVEKSMGDIQRIYDVCGRLGYCDKCKSEDNKDGCQKYYLAYQIRTSGDITIANTLNGEIVIEDNWEVIE